MPQGENDPVALGGQMNNSVLQDWVNALPHRQQGVLVLSLRGPDGVRKEDAAKPIVRTLRGMTMNAGRTGEPMKRGTLWIEDPFMTLYFIDSDEHWLPVGDAFFDQWDAYNVHFLQHLIHAYAICGMHFPADDIRERAWNFYTFACHKLHMGHETPKEITYRLRSGKREEEDGK